jgi:CheY-like chemotaxis protein
VVSADAFVLRTAVQGAVLREAVARAAASRSGRFEHLPSAEPPKLARVKVAEGQRVLVVDDNLVNQRLAERLLAREGCVVTVASNGFEAIARWEAQPFDLVLMDCNMPELDGLEATRRIRLKERERCTHTPIIALTADAMESDRQACLRSGMDDYLSKPIREERLREALTTHFAGRHSGTRPAAEVAGWKK